MIKKETNLIAKKLGWESGIHFPEWGNNSLYLTTIKNGYLQKDETPKDAYTRIANTACKYLKKPELFNNFFEILWNGWLIPSTPVMSNFGTNKGLPISCFSGRIGDDMHEIFRKNTEMAMLSKYGGGTAYDISQIRPSGSLIRNGERGIADGIIPFIKVYDSTIIASKQASVRRGAVALYLDIEHQEYKNFLEVREPKGDVNRQAHNIHQGVVISDKFMNEVIEKKGKAREIWLDTLKKRVKTGEPYLMFIDNANKNKPKNWKEHNLKIWHSNLCSEIFLCTDNEHTLVCCLSSLNLFKYDEWKNTETVFYSTLLLDAVISEFIDKGKNIKGIEDSIRFAEKSRALGLGTLGWHTYLQSKMIPFISIQSNSLTNIIFNHIEKESKRASKWLANEYGEPLWMKNTGYRNLTNIAIAPNRSSSKLAGGLSQGIEPFGANAYVDDDAKGLHMRKNPILKNIIKKRGINNDIWDRINEEKGSIKNISEFTNEEKEVFKTFKEINQLELIRQAGIRQKYIDQGQSINLAFYQDAPARFINQVHLEAWKVGLKSLYYFRSESNLRADKNEQRDLYSECLMCQG